MILRSIGIVTLAVGLLAGCASTDSKKGDDSEYEYVRATGSNLRIKVRKGERPQSGTVGVGTAGAMEVHETPNQMETPAGAAGG